MMRSFAILALVSATVLNSASASVLVEARRKTTVTQGASAFQNRTSSERGCDPSGCSADLTRDEYTSDASRWSCREDQQDGSCTIKYQFEEPQDIVYLDIQFYKGHQRVRKLKVTGSGDFTADIESSGTTDGYERFDVNNDETAWLNIEARGLGSAGWLSINEVRFMVVD